MKLSKDLEGSVVTIQLARPLYVMDYAGHMQAAPGHPTRTQLLAQPLTQATKDGPQPMLMDLLLGVIVQEVADDHLKVRMVTPGSHWADITVPSQLIMQVVELVAFEPTDLPTITKHVREEPKKPLVQL